MLHPTAEHLTVAVIGELDGPTTRELAAILSRAVERGGRVVHLDLSQVSFIAAGGAVAIAAAAAAADRLGAPFAIVKTSTAARRGLEAAGLASMVTPTPAPLVVDIR